MLIHLFGESKDNYYYKQFRLGKSVTEFTLPLILELFRAGNKFDMTVYTTPSDPESLYSQIYGYRESDTYYEQLKEWFADGLSPSKDMELIIF